MLDNLSIVLNCILIVLVCARAVRLDPDVKQKNTHDRPPRAGFKP